MVEPEAPTVQLPIDSDLLNQLREHHYAIVDDFLPPSFADQLLDDATRLHSQNHFQQHYFQFGGCLLKKPNVHELDLTDPKILETLEMGYWKQVVSNVGPSFVRQIDKLDRQESQQQNSSATISQLALQTQLPPAVKLQLNTGGGSFPWHYDNPGPPNQRSLTCVVYLNPKWKHGDGGEIVLWPFLSQQIEIPPLHGRAVLFYSDRILHRVLPSNVHRVCFTMWCNGEKINAKEDTLLSKDVLQFTSYDDAQSFFSRSPLQRVISRAVYGKEYLESMLECLVAGGKRSSDIQCGNEGVSKEEEEKVVKQHVASVLAIEGKLRPLIEEFRRRKDLV